MSEVIWTEDLKKTIAWAKQNHHRYTRTYFLAEQAEKLMLQVAELNSRIDELLIEKQDAADYREIEEYRCRICGNTECLGGCAHG